MPAEKSKAEKMLKEISKAHYIMPKEVNREEHPVAWCTSIVPVEFLRAMDILPLFPENHSAMIGAAKMGVELAEVAEAAGYSTDICSYARADIGHIFSGKSPVSGLAKPDLLVCCNNICSTVIKWYENLSYYFNVPLYLIDTPFNHGPQVPATSIDYIKGQFNEFINWLEEVTGKKMDYDRLKEVIELSQRNSELWREVLEMGKHRPAPFAGFDTFNYMIPAVTLRGTEEAVSYYLVLKNELEQIINEGSFPVSEEKYRLLFHGIPVWYMLRPMSELLKEHKANIVCSTYTEAWILDFEGDTLEEKMESMAESYTKVMINQNLQQVINYILQRVKEFSINGILQHSNRSCKPYCFGIYDISQVIQKSSYAIPSLIFDGDQTDSRNFSWSQFENRFQSFIEMLK